MNPIEIKVEVNLGEATLRLLQKLLQIAGKSDAQTTKTSTSAAAPVEAAQKAPEAPKPAPKEEHPDDMPGPITDEELRIAVKAAKDKTSAADVKAVFSQFGIKTSIECPDEKRYELLTALVELSK